MKPIYVSIVGSRLYGIATEESDADIKGIGFNEVNEYCSLKKVEQVDVSNKKEGKESFNGTIYEVARCFHLLFKGNPTVLEPFWANKEFIIHTSKVGEDIAKFVRENMISKHFFDPYFGYHHSQIKEFICSNRVGKRKELFDKYGFDGKFAGHAYRLAKQCCMIMKEGKLDPTLRGEDREIVMRMRKYEMTKDECTKLLYSNVDEMKLAYEQSTLPEKVDYDKVNDFVNKVVCDYLVSQRGIKRKFLDLFNLNQVTKTFDINKFPK